jgi:hypothetical protein
MSQGSPRKAASDNRLISALNGDIDRELRMAAQCVEWASTLAPAYLRLRRYLVRCAASAQANAIALAVEIVALGGAPPHGGERSSYRRGPAPSIEQCVADALRLVSHYQARLDLAERLGLARLREVFREIVSSKRSHLLHAGLVAAGAARPVQLS